MQWFENEAFWETFYDYMFSPAHISWAPDEIERDLKLCGYGPARHSAILAQKNFRVTAVDRSPFLLSKANKHLENFAVRLRVLQNVRASLKFKHGCVFVGCSWKRISGWASFKHNLGGAGELRFDGSPGTH